MRKTFLSLIIIIALCVAGYFLFKKTTPEVSLSTSSASGAQSEPLLHEADINWSGAFRVPVATDDAHSYNYQGFGSRPGLSYWPAHDSLVMQGHNSYGYVGEFNIPSGGTGPTVNDLPHAIHLQAMADLFQGHRTDIDGDTYNGISGGGIMPYGSYMIGAVYSKYDASIPYQKLSHFKIAGQNFSASPTVTGPYQVGTGYDVGGVTSVAGFSAGYMTPVPSEWQSLLGGPVLTGQSGDISIIGRTSRGPAACIFDPDNLGVISPVPCTKVVGYPGGHTTLGEWNQPGSGLGLYNGGQGFNGVVFVPGTRTVIFFGWDGDFCYGEGTLDPALDGLPTPDGSEYCYDGNPNSTSVKGTHYFPIYSAMWLYDANDFLAVKNGTKQPWDVVPYDTIRFTMPMQSHIVNGIEQGTFSLVGAAYRITTHQIIVASSFGDGVDPLLHVLDVTIPGLIPSPSPTPTPTPIIGDLNNDGIVNSLDWSLMSSKWFTNDAASDLNHDGIVNSIDFSILNNNWLKTT